MGERNIDMNDTTPLQPYPPITLSPPLPPGSTIGILGGGQLGRMLAIAAAELGYHAHIYCPEADCPASEVAAHTTTAEYEDLDTLRRFATQVDVVTYEFENIPAAPVMELAKHTPVWPSPDTLLKSQHRVTEKTMLNKLGIATAPFVAVNSLEELQEAVNELGLPSVLKTCRMGYDGKGQAMLKASDEIEQIWQHMDDGWRMTDHASSSVIRHPSSDFILEGFVSFRMEISVVIARNAQGISSCYCPVQNIHKHHILSETIAPASISEALSKKAEQVARTIADGMQLVGLMAIEMFVTDNDEILVNELAPRPHNSGHWTIDACVTSQFTQTIRAICGLPLGSPNRLCNARMLNLIGDDILEWERYAATPNAKLHLYGKKESRPGRKMGHVTFLAVAGC